MRGAVVTDMDGISEFQTVELTPSNWFTNIPSSYIAIAYARVYIQGVDSKESH